MGAHIQHGIVLHLLCSSVRSGLLCHAHVTAGDLRLRTSKYSKAPEQQAPCIIPATSLL
jgi:hypothetical protein